MYELSSGYLRDIFGIKAGYFSCKKIGNYIRIDTDLNDNFRLFRHQLSSILRNPITISQEKWTFSCRYTFLYFEDTLPSKLLPPHAAHTTDTHTFYKKIGFALLYNFNPHYYEQAHIVGQKLLQIDWNLLFSYKKCSFTCVCAFFFVPLHAILCTQTYIP